MSGGRTMTDRGFTQYEKDLAAEERMRKDSGFWRTLQVAAVLSGVVTLANVIVR